MPDSNNTAINYYFNENQRDKIDKNLIEPCVVSSIYNFYEELLEVDVSLNLGSICFIIVVPYLNFISTSQKLDSELKNDSFFNIVKFPNLYIIPEKIIINDQIPDINNFQLRNLAKLFITNFIGGIVNEMDFADFWLISGIENWLVFNFMTKCYGNIYMKGILVDTMNKYKNIVKKGQEVRPLYNNNYTHPVELQYDSILYLKSLIVMLLLESYVEKIYILKALRNIINERSKSNFISTEIFIKILKKNCGINLKKFTNLWIFKTGMLLIKYNHTYKEESNSIEIILNQLPLIYDYVIENPLIKPDFQYEKLKKISKIPPFIDFTLKSNRHFDISLNITVFQTNGYEILKETHGLTLEPDNDVSYKNIPLITKLRKGQIKKREQEFIQELISNTSITKIYSNEDIEKIMTENSVLWIRIDPEMSCLRNIIDSSEKNIIFEYIKLFKDPDLVGQFEALKNIYYRKESYENSLIILETFIKSNLNIYYKLRIYAIKIYLKIIHYLKQENGYLFLIDFLSDLYSDFIKNKSNLMREDYLIIKHVIRNLGEYKEGYFNEFNIIGKIKLTDVQKKIIDKFLIILLSNEFNSISNFNDCYLIREILVGCSKLQLQDKTFYFLKKILQLLRIEKLKRSFNEIIIIGAIESYINFLVHNQFLAGSIGKEEDSYMKDLIFSINDEITYFIQSEYERQELGVVCAYFVVFMLFSKSVSIYDFILEVKKYTNVSNDHCNLLNNSNIRTRITGLIMFLNSHIHSSVLLSSVEMESFIKECLLSEYIYNQVDFRKAFQMLFKKYTDSKNTNRVKLVDETWLSTFINNIKDTHKINKDSDCDSDDINNPAESIKMKILRYQSKYNDPYLVNYELALENYSIRDRIMIILGKINEHPLSDHFNYELNRISLGDLYDQYFKAIKTPMDFETIQKKFESNKYSKMEDFLSDMTLVFKNARTFNDKRSVIFQAANQLEEFYHILVYSIQKSDKRVELNTNTKISLTEGQETIGQEIGRKNTYQSDDIVNMEVDELNSDY